MQSLDTLIQSYMDQQIALGAAIALLKNGEIIYRGGFGATTVAEHGVSVTPHTLFYYGSICKTLCATMVMRLVEQGQLVLDTPIVHYLPDLHFSNPVYGQKVTLRHLLSHTSGLPMGGKYWGSRDPEALRRFVYEQIPQYTFLSEPGAVHLYSNTVFCIAGHVAEAVTGKFYDDLMQEYVFDPLQMSSVTYDPVVAMTRSVAIRHEPDADGRPQPLRKLPYNVSGNPSSFAYGSVADLAKLAQIYVNQGRFGDQQFLSPSSVVEMQRSQGNRYLTGAALGWIYGYSGYGLGFEVGEYRGRRVARHGGATVCYFDLFPDDQAGVILLTNFQNERLVLEMLAELYEYVLDLPQRGVFFLDKPTPMPTPPDAKQLEQLCGTYLRIETGELATIAVAGDKLCLEQHGNATPLIPLDNHQFYAEFSERQRLPIAFIAGSEGNMAHAMIGGEPYHPVQIDPNFTPDLPLWQTYAGLYKDPSNTNHDEMFRIRVQDGVLYLAENEQESPCQALSNRQFLSDLVGSFEFVDTEMEGVKVLVWGKATRYFPVDQQEYRVHRVIKYNYQSL